MNPFVNPNQRGIDLPPGCKDLIDVIKPKASASRVNQLPGTDPEFFKAPFHRFYEPDADVAIGILLPSSKTFIYLFRFSGQQQLHFCFKFAEITLNGAIRDFFGTRDIAPLQEVAAQSFSMVRYPLPATALESAELISQLLQQVYRENGPIYLHLVPAPKPSK